MVSCPSDLFSWLVVVIGAIVALSNLLSHGVTFVHGEFIFFLQGGTHDKCRMLGI